MQLVEDRDEALEASRTALVSGGKSVGLDVTIAALGWPTAECVVGGQLSLGTSCIRLLLALIVAGGGAVIQFDNAVEARHEADEFGQSARGIFEELGP
jgi:hypothetical protein